MVGLRGHACSRAWGLGVKGGNGGGAGHGKPVFVNNRARIFPHSLSKNMLWELFEQICRECCENFGAERRKEITCHFGGGGDSLTSRLVLWGTGDPICRPLSQKPFSWNLCIHTAKGEGSYGQDSPHPNSGHSHCIEPCRNSQPNPPTNQGKIAKEKLCETNPERKALGGRAVLNKTRKKLSGTSNQIHLKNG